MHVITNIVCRIKATEGLKLAYRSKKIIRATDDEDDDDNDDDDDSNDVFKMININTHL